MFVYKVCVDGDSIYDIGLVTEYPELSDKGKVVIISLSDNEYTLVPECHSHIEFTDESEHELEVFVGFTAPLNLEECDKDGWWVRRL